MSIETKAPYVVLHMFAMVSSNPNVANDEETNDVQTLGQTREVVAYIEALQSALSAAREDAARLAVENVHMYVRRMRYAGRIDANDCATLLRFCSEGGVKPPTPFRDPDEVLAQMYASADAVKEACANYDAAKEVSRDVLDMEMRNSLNLDAGNGRYHKPLPSIDAARRADGGR